MFVFFNDTATTEIYTLSLHDALPILLVERQRPDHRGEQRLSGTAVRMQIVGHVGEVSERQPLAGRLQYVADQRGVLQDRKSTRLNSSHANISYAVFCLKKKNIILIAC